MKLNKRTILVLAVGLFLVGAFVLVTNLNSEMNKRDVLQKQLATLQKNLKAAQIEPLSTQKANLEQNMTQTVSHLSAITPILSQPVEKTEVMSVLFSTANATGVNITTLRISELSNADLVQVGAKSLSMYLTVEGDLQNITGVITNLNTIFTTGAVDQDTITSIGNGLTKQADMRLTLYTVQE